MEDFYDDEEKDQDETSKLISDSISAAVQYQASQLDNQIMNGMNNQPGTITSTGNSPYPVAGTPVPNSAGNIIINPGGTPTVSKWNYIDDWSPAPHRITGDFDTVREKKNLGGGYWAIIKVYEKDDEVWYSLNKGDKIRRYTWRIPYWDFQFNRVTSGDTLETRLGNAYLEMDKMILKAESGGDHRKFVKDMVKTHPKNLKMIAGLDTLDKETRPASSGVDQAPQYAQSFRVSGSGAYFKGMNGTGS